MTVFIILFIIFLILLLLLRAQLNETDSEGKTTDRIEKLTRLKDLLDKGIITQEEFDEKKKQLLEL